MSKMKELLDAEVCEQLEQLNKMEDKNAGEAQTLLGNITELMKSVKTLGELDHADAQLELDNKKFRFEKLIKNQEIEFRRKELELECAKLTETKTTRNVNAMFKGAGGILMTLLYLSLMWYEQTGVIHSTAMTKLLSAIMKPPFKTTV